MTSRARRTSQRMPPLKRRSGRRRRQCPGAWPHSLWWLSPIKPALGLSVPAGANALGPASLGRQLLRRDRAAEVVALEVGETHFAAGVDGLLAVEPLSDRGDADVGGVPEQRAQQRA